MTGGIGDSVQQVLQQSFDSVDSLENSHIKYDTVGFINWLYMTSLT